MKRFGMVSLIFLTGLLVLCGDDSGGANDDDNNTIPGDHRSFIGEWTDTLDANAAWGMPNPVIVGVSITEDSNAVDSTDSAFVIFTKEMPAMKDLYIHNGIWKMNGTVITLYGKECRLINVTTTVDSMISQPDSINLKTISFDTLGMVDSTLEWVKIDTLCAIKYSIPSYAKYPDFTAAQFLTLKKQKDSVAINRL